MLSPARYLITLLLPIVLTLQGCGGDGGGNRSPDTADQPDPPDDDSGAVSMAGLDFPGSEGTVETMRFRFPDPLPIYPATYIWRVFPRYQAGFYTAFFWGNDGEFQWHNGIADSYYGAHPYPRDNLGNETPMWELSVDQADFRDTPVVFERWYTQALRVRATATGKVHEFYWDLPHTDSAHRVTHTTDPDYGDTPPPAPALTWGDAPWNQGREVWNGVITGIRVYSAWLSLDDILEESNAPTSTDAGAANIWYLNMSPTPDDIADRSGRGNDPEWVGEERPALWVP